MAGLIATAVVVGEPWSESCLGNGWLSSPFCHLITMILFLPCYLRLYLPCLRFLNDIE
jgi:hypothetical protein